MAIGIVVARAARPRLVTGLVALRRSIHFSRLRFDKAHALPIPPSTEHFLGVDDSRYPVRSSVLRRLRRVGDAGRFFDFARRFSRRQALILSAASHTS
jgi:hypothetical protein